jgi:adenosylcobyric acid synthase
MIGSAKAAEYQTMKAGLMEPVLESFSLLAKYTDLVLVEGAGAVSEVNLRANDIANFGFARASGIPVILVADIDRGGVIASLAGTKVVVDPADAALIRGFIVNKFRGDPALFAEGMTTIAKHTGWTPLGLVPYFPDAAKLPAEDALGLERPLAGKGRARTKIAVLAYPRISNFDDFDPLRLEPHVDLVFVKPGQSIPADASLVILPGSKSTIADLQALRESGWHIDLEAHVRRGGHVLGVCGGYQMLGTSVADPDGIEGPPVTVPGLAYLDVETRMLGEKQLYEVDAESADGGIPFRGYEMHVGESVGEGARRPLLHIHHRPDGAVSADGRISGCYVHGLFAGDRHRAHWLAKIGARTSALNYEQEIEATLDALATHLERHIDCDAILALAQIPSIAPPE